jgi:hypothetical protein
MTGRHRPIVLKKSASVSTAEKSAFEIEVLTLRKGFRAQISRSSVKKGVFTAQRMDSLDGWTFSTESVKCIQNSRHQRRRFW